MRPSLAISESCQHITTHQLLIPLGSRTGHVPHLRLVRDATAENTSASRAIAIIDTCFQIRDVLELLFHGQLVECLAEGELLVDFLLRNTKVGHIEEAFCPYGFYERLRQSSIAFGRPILGQINVRNCSQSLAASVL